MQNSGDLSQEIQAFPNPSLPIPQIPSTNSAFNFYSFKPKPKVIPLLLDQPKPKLKSFEMRVKNPNFSIFFINNIIKHPKIYTT